MEGRFFNWGGTRSRIKLLRNFCATPPPSSRFAMITWLTTRLQSGFRVPPVATQKSAFADFLVCAVWDVIRTDLQYHK
jgi:hypothetical protein